MCNDTIFSYVTELNSTGCIHFPIIKNAYNLNRHAFKRVNDQGIERKG